MHAGHLEEATRLSASNHTASFVVVMHGLHPPPKYARSSASGVAVALVTWCMLARSTPIKIAAIFLAIRIILALGAMWLVSRMSAVA